VIEFATKLLELLPKAIAWAEAQSRIVLEQGMPLPAPGISDARIVGVANPELIRVALVPSLPLPDDEDLRAFAMQTGLLGPGQIPAHWPMRS